MTRTQKTALRGMLIAVAFVLSWLEAQLPPLAMVPGVKLGLTNLVVLVAIYRLSTMDALVINGIRILLVAFTFGNMFSLLYSFAGGMLSTIVMLLLKRSGRFRLPVVSVAGGIVHNLGVLWFSGMIAGAVVGMIGAGVVKRLPEEEQRG